MWRWAAEKTDGGADSPKLFRHTGLSVKFSLVLSETYCEYSQSSYCYIPIKILYILHHIPSFKSETQNDKSGLYTKRAEQSDIAEFGLSQMSQKFIEHWDNDNYVS